MVNSRLRKVSLATEASLFLLASKLLLTLPFPWIARWLGTLHGTSPDELPAEQADIVDTVAWAVRAAPPRLPFSATCMTKAVAAKAMLRRRNIPSTLYLGVRHDERAGLGAHAWLRAGRITLTGEAESQSVVEVARYS